MDKNQSQQDWQLTVYIPREIRDEDPIGQLQNLAQQQRRSINFLVVEAIREYLKQQLTVPLQSNINQQGE